MIRELVLDTETTGLSPENGHKIVEIGIVELINHLPTERTFHKYLNPERSIPNTAFKVHGLDYEFLKDKPFFSEICDEMMDFIGSDQIIIHNASFDLGFLNYELSNIKKSKIKNIQVIDTLIMARMKFPGSPASLDALCRRFSINNSNRTLHGALLDSYLLAQVYLELIGGSQPDLDLKIHESLHGNLLEEKMHKKPEIFSRPSVLANRLSTEERIAHQEFIEKINGLNNWLLYN